MIYFPFSFSSVAHSASLVYEPDDDIDGDNLLFRPLGALTAPLKAICAEPYNLVETDDVDKPATIGTKRHAEDSALLPRKSRKHSHGIEKHFYTKKNRATTKWKVVLPNFNVYNKDDAIGWMKDTGFAVGDNFEVEVMFQSLLANREG